VGFKSPRIAPAAFAAIHETMDALHDISAISKQTMREFDEACLTPVHVLAPRYLKLSKRVT